LTLTLRPYQTAGVAALRAAYRAGAHAPIYVAPGGSGKTVLFAYITEAAARRGNRVLILVHRAELLQQTSRKLFDVRVAHGLIAPGHTPSSDPVQVASVQTLVRRLAKFPAPDLIIVDECHHAVGTNTWARVLSAYPSASLLGVTATPLRLDGKGLGVESGGFFDRLVEGPTVADLVVDGYLSHPVVYAPPVPMDLTGIRRKYGDYAAQETAERMDKPTITGCAVAHYSRICPGVPAIAFCASVKHAEHVAGQFEAAGIPATSIDGTMTDVDRRRAISDLASGRIKVLTSCEIVSEGTDIPVVTAAILLRPTMSTGLFIQQCGRALRPHPSKDRSIILDHVGNTFRHGFPDDVREWSLDGEKQGKRKVADADPEVSVVQCESCYMVFRRAEGRCPECGWIPPVQARTIQEVEGELKEIQECEKSLMRLRQRAEVGQARTLEALQQIGRQRGYKPGWAVAVYNARMAKGQARTAQPVRDGRDEVADA